MSNADSSKSATAAPAPINFTAISEDQAAKAFALWETRFRSGPADFLTRDEVERMAVADLATSSAIYFLSLLREVQA